MKDLKYHFFVCVDERPPGMKESCAGRVGSTAREVFEAFVDAVEKHQLWYEVLVSSCGCLGVCSRGTGTTVAVYPEGTWYSPVSIDDVAEIVREHILRGARVERLVYAWPEQLRYVRRESCGAGELNSTDPPCVAREPSSP